MTLNRSLFFTTVGLLFAALFIPLIVTNSLFFPFITGKNFTFRIVVELAALSWVILMLRDKSYRPKFSWLSVSLVFFVGIVAVADMLGSNPVKSFLSNFERMEGWITLIHLLIFFLLMTAVFKTWANWQRFFQVSVGVSLIICIYGFLQLAGKAAIHQSVSRLDASFGNATYLAIYMLFHVFITLILLTRRIKDKRDLKTWYKDWLVYVYVVAMILQSFVLFYTATRGSILGLVGGLILAAILVAITEREYKILRKISIGVLVVLAIVIGLFFLTKNTSFVRNNEVLGRIASISLSDGTTMSRFLIWGMAWKGVTQDPKHFVLGWGQESFNYIFNTYYNPKMYSQEQWFDRSHDIVFDWLTQAGILGLLSYLSIFGFTLYFLWRKSTFSRLEKSLITGLLAGYFFHNLFVFDNIVSYIMFFVILAYVNVFSTTQELEELEEKGKRSQPAELDSSLQYGGMILAAIIFIVVFYQYDYKPIAANRALIRALTQTQMPATTTGGSPSLVYVADNVNAFKEAISYNTIGLYETREQLMDIAAKAVSSNSGNEVKSGLVNLTETEIKRQLNETPNDVRYYVLGGVFYQNISDYKDAATLLTKAVDLSPTKQTVMFALGSNYFALNQLPEALATFKKAYELDTDFGEAKTLYGLVAFYDGQEDLTNSLLGPGPIMDPRFLSAYQQTKHYDLMIAYLEKDATNKPTDIQTQVNLAAGYMTVGSQTKAIAVLNKIKTLTTDQSILSQIDPLIKQIQAGKNPFQAQSTASAQ